MMGTMKGSRTMPHLLLAFVNERLLAEDEAKLERLRDFYRGRPPVRDDCQHILYQAADILDHLGWCRGALERDEQHCAIGAIIAAYNQGEVRCKDYADSVFLRDCAVQSIVGKVESHLNRLGEGKEVSLMEWNDSVARSRKKVVGLLRAAACQS
jgi:hypothetical protein